MRIGIIGSGALASLFGARLHPHLPVVMVGSWVEQIRTIQQRGLTLIGPDGTRSQHLIEITPYPASVDPVDIALVLVKSYQTPDAAKRVQTLLKPEGLCVTLQNGLGNVERLGFVLGEERVRLGTTSEGATMEAPGVVRHAGAGVTVVDKRAARLALALQSAGFEVQTSGDVRVAQWRKLIINAGINPLSSIVRQPNGFLVEDKQAHAIMVAAAREAAAVARSLDVPLGEFDPLEAVSDVALHTAANRSSMLQDVERNAQTEIEEITGRIVELAEEQGVPVPANRMLLRFLRIYEESRIFRWQSYAVSIANLYQIFQEESAGTA